MAGVGGAAVGWAGGGSGVDGGGAVAKDGVLLRDGWGWARAGRAAGGAAQRIWLGLGRFCFWCEKRWRCGRRAARRVKVENHDITITVRVKRNGGLTRLHSAGVRDLQGHTGARERTHLSESHRHSHESVPSAHSTAAPSSEARCARLRSLLRPAALGSSCGPVGVAIEIAAHIRPRATRRLLRVWRIMVTLACACEKNGHLGMKSLSRNS